MMDLLMAGMSWTLFVGPSASWESQFPEFVSDRLFLRPAVAWPIIAMEFTFHRNFAYLMQIDLDEAPEGRWTEMHESDDCPCGLPAAQFGQCCAGRWLSTGA